MNITEACKKALLEINYETIFNAVINDNEDKKIEETKDDSQHNLLDDEEYKLLDNTILKIYNRLIEHNIKGDLFEEDKETRRTYRHIAINRDFNQRNKIAIFMSPKNNYIYYIISELMKRSYKENKSIYFKYTRENKIEKIIIYAVNTNDAYEKLEMIDKIKQEYPVLFTDMKRSKGWISRTNIEGVYIEPDKLIKKNDGTEYENYEELFRDVLNEMKSKLLLKLKDINVTIEELRENKIDEINDLFMPICIDIIGKYGILLYEDNEKLKVFVNEKFPGVEKPLI